LSGNVLTICVEAGETVTAGQALAVLEAAKTEHTVASPRDGVVKQVLIAKDEFVEAGRTLAVLC